MKTQSSARPFGFIRLSVALLAAMVFGVLATTSALAAGLTIDLRIVDGNGVTVPGPLPGYRWTVEEDRTKLNIPGQSSTLEHYSFSFHTSYMPVVAAGRVGAPGVASTQDPDVMRLYTQTPDALNLVPGKRYYLSVAAQGFQVGGAPFVAGSDGSATATVILIKYPVPTAQISVLVFNDNYPTNNTAELPQEEGLKGFTVQLIEAGGTYGQSGGQVTQDAFGNPLGTTYLNENHDVDTVGTGIILTDANGVAIIKNLYPAKYTILVSPRLFNPVTGEREDWHQNSTIEGTKGVDAWVKNNESPGFYEFGPPGYHVFYAFVNAANSGCLQKNSAGSYKNSDGSCVGMSASGNSVTGRIVSVHDARPPALTLDVGPPVPQCWVALNNSATGQGLYATACDKDSRFTIPNVPNGTYQLVVWDEPINTIIGFSTVNVRGAAVNLGDVPQLGWFGRYQGRVFQDIDGTGLPYFVADYDRPYVYVNPMTGVEEERQQNFKKGDLKPALGAGVASNIRFRDGSIYQSTATKDDGTFAFTEVFPFFNWTVAEIDYARFKATSANIVVDNGGPINAAANLSKLWGLAPNASGTPTLPYKGLFGSNEPSDPWTRINPQPQLLADGALTEGGLFRMENCGETGQCAILLEGMSLYANQTNHIEWGKVPYKITENGGIAGIVYYAITRAEDDPRFAAAENWEPGIPRVQVNVYLDCNGDGKVDKPKNDGTGDCAVGGLSGAASVGGNGYVADLPDVDNYPFCWRGAGDVDLCPVGAPTGMGPEDDCRSAACKAATGTKPFSYGDVFRWGSPGQDPDEQAHFGVGKTDAWDDSIPTACPTRALDDPKFKIPYGPDKGKEVDCWDGLRNWNQLRPSVFDGGFAFGRVAGQAELPMIIGDGKGTYILEAVAPPGYLHQGNGDKNVTFGDELASRPISAALPHECVGMDLPVPQYLTLFEGLADPNPNYTGPGQTWKKCDMKAVPLLPGMNAAPNFFMFTEAPVAAHGMGLLTDDLNNTFDPLSPNYGEKYAPPFIAISIQDWTGRELARTYSDEYGRYNFLAPSTFTINPPYPSGVMPNMIQACLNHPGPITHDPVTGAPYASPQIDPYFNRRYTQQCYTLQYLSGKTTYLDTPMLPVSAFAPVEKTPLDCECENLTPAINRAFNGSNGPWVPADGDRTLTIVSDGKQEVSNPAFDPVATSGLQSQRTILRDYGFGTTAGSVTVGGIPLTDVLWADDIITGTVPTTVPEGQYQLVIKRGDNNKESVVGLTVHVGGLAPIKVPADFPTIQAAINASGNGGLITIAPGSYNEALILDKRIRLQGWGAGSTAVNPIITTGPAPVAWRALLNSKAITPTNPGGTFNMLPGQSLAVDPATGLPSLLGAEEQSGVLVLGKMLDPSNPTAGCSGAGISLRVDGLSITGSITGGGVLANGYACNLQISNNRVFSNSGTYGGGIRIGHTALVAGTVFVDAVNRNVSMHHNWVAENGAIAVGAAGATGGGGGGITLGTGSDNYSVASNYVCGNFTLADGAGVSHYGRSTPASIAGNTIIFNQNFDQGQAPSGGGLSIAAPIAPAGGTAAGTGDVTVNANLFQGNQAGAGAGSAVSIARTLPADDVVLTNNMIINNVTGYAGAVALSAVTPSVRLVNNTIANNVSTATASQALAIAAGAPSIAQVAGVALLNGPAAPTMLNNIMWGNRSYVFLIGGEHTALCNPGATTLTAAGACSPAGSASYRDLGAVSSTATLEPRYSVFSDTSANRTAYAGTIPGLESQCSSTGPNTNNSGLRCNKFELVPAAMASTPLFETANDFTASLQSAVTVDEGGNFVNVIYSPLTRWNIDASGNTTTPLADYHIRDNAVARNNGRNAGTNTAIGANYVPPADFDAQSRVSPVDIGADENFGAVPIPRVTPSSLAFGNVSLNTAPVTLAVTVTNDVGSTQNLVLANPTITGANATNFTWSLGTCQIGVAMGAGTSCTINVTFATAVVGLRTATLNVNSNVPAIAVSLTGTGVVPTYAITPASRDFGNVGVGNTSALFQFTITNTTVGGELWLSGNPVLTGTNAGQFQAAFRVGDTCTSATHLVAGASCTFSVTFTPTSPGCKGTLVAGVCTPNTTVNIPKTSGTGSSAGVSGTGTGAFVSFTAASFGTLSGTTTRTLAFGNRNAVTPSTVTITNTGTAPVTYGTATVSNGSPPAFSKGTDNCSGSTRAAGQTCQIQVIFAGPSGNQPRTGALSVPSSALNNPAVLNLTGN